MKGFFRLGKLDHSKKDEKDKPESSRRDEGVDSGGSSVSASAPQERDEKHKKSKKKPEDVAMRASGPAEGSGGGAAGSGSEARTSTSVPARTQGAGLSVNDFISKTKNQQRQGLKPSGPELIAYARYLGIDPVNDHDLLWIAVDALEAPLPSDWTEHFDSNDRVFYYNATMRVSSWTHPLEHKYRETYKTIVNFRNANMGVPERNSQLTDVQLEVKQMEHDVHKEIAQWTEHQDDQGNRFYFNREERQSTWTDPRPAKCQILYLKMKMLRLLQQSTGGAQLFADNKDISRFAPLNSDFDDPAFKRPKKANATAEGGLWPNKQGGGAGSWSEAETDNLLQRSSVPSSPSCSARGSDSGTEDERKKKKKKKKGKKKKRDQGPPAEPPPRPGGARNLSNSQSEPTVGGKALLANVDDVRGGAGGMGGLQTSVQPAGSHYGSLGVDDSGGLSNVGRARVKAGVRLEPIKLDPAGIGGGGPAPSPGDGRLGQGVRNSASVPALQP